MIGKKFRYKGLDFSDNVQNISQQTSWYSYIIQDNVRNISTKTTIFDNANSHWWYSWEALAWPRLFSFTGKVIGTNKTNRDIAWDLLVSNIKPEWTLNALTRGFYDLNFQDDWGNERTVKCKVYWVPEPTNWLGSPVIDFTFELLWESEKIYWVTTYTITGTRAFFGWITLPTTLPIWMGGYAWAIPITNAWNWIAPCKIQIIWQATNPKIINITNGNKYRLDLVTTNLILDNRNLNINPLETFIVTDNWVNVKEFRNSWADISLEAWLNYIAILTDDPTETPVVKITYRDTYIY